MRQDATRPRRPEPYQLFLLSSLVLAVFGGFFLAILISLGRAAGWRLEAGKPELVQLHGQLQLLGFAGLYVMGMSMRLLPGFARLRLRFAWLAYPVLAAFLTGLLARFLVMPWLGGAAHEALLVGSQVVILAGALGFALVVLGSLAGGFGRAGATGFFFATGAVLLVSQALVGLYAAIDAARSGARLISYLPDTAVTDLVLAGFVLAFIGGVSGRIIPTMVGLRPSPRAGKAVALTHAVLLLLLAGFLLWLGYIDYSSLVVRLADLALAALGPVFLAIVWLTRIQRVSATRLRPASKPHLWLVRVAFGWLAFAGCLATYYGVRAFIDGTLPAQNGIDAIRHALGVGLVTTLIVGMSLLIVPEFAGQRMNQPSQGWLSFLLLTLLTAAAFCRVLPALAGTDWPAATRDWLLVVAGCLAETAMVLFALAFLDLMLAGPPLPSQLPSGSGTR